MRAMLSSLTTNSPCPHRPPRCSPIESVLAYCLVTGIQIERDLWRGERENLYQGIASVSVGLASLRLRFRLRVIQTLSAQDLRVETPHRNFCVLVNPLLP